MQPAATPATSNKILWTGRILSALLAIFFLFISSMNLMKPDEVVKNTAKLGYNPDVIRPLGAALLVSTLLYIFPRTALLGAILLTGYLGGAVDCHVRAGDPFFARAMVPVYFGIATWLGLYLRDPRIRALAPIADR